MNVKGLVELGRGRGEERRESAPIADGALGKGCGAGMGEHPG